MRLTEFQSHYCITEATQNSSVADWPQRCINLVGRVLVSGILGH